MKTNKLSLQRLDIQSFKTSSKDIKGGYYSCFCTPDGTHNTCVSDNYTIMDYCPTVWDDYCF